MTTQEIDAALDGAERVLGELVAMAPTLVALDRAIENGEFTSEQLRRHQAISDMMDEAGKLIP